MRPVQGPKRVLAFSWMPTQIICNPLMSPQRSTPTPCTTESALQAAHSQWQAVASKENDGQMTHANPQACHSVNRIYHITEAKPRQKLIVGDKVCDSKRTASSVHPGSNYPGITRIFCSSWPWSRIEWPISTLRLPH